MHTHYALTRADYERELDVTLAGSFPASDPPPWTLGVASADDFFGDAIPAPVPAAIDVVTGDGHRFGGTRLASLAEAIALVATIPVAVLIAGVPVALLVWSLAHAIARLAGGH
jgi:hypothetical protein